MDVNTNAFRIVRQLAEPNEEKPRSEATQQAGKSGGPTRVRALPRERRVEIALKANRARWAKGG